MYFLPMSVKMRRLFRYLIFVLSVIILLVWIYKYDYSYDIIETNPLSFHQEMMDVILERRHKHLKERARRICAENNQTLVSDVRQLRPGQLSHILLDMEHKLLHCNVPKSGCTNWKRVWLILTNQTNATRPSDIDSYKVHVLYASRYRTLGSIPANERPDIVKSFMKFVIIRDPLERLISVYRNKYLPGADASYKQHRKAMAQLIAQESGNTEVIQPNSDGDYTIPFHLFVKYTYQRAKGGAGMDAHYDSQARLCQPCAIDYDIIGSFYHIDDEARYILRTAKVDHLVQYPPPSKFRDYKGGSNASMKDMYSSVSDDLIMKLYSLYLTDYMVFDLPYHTFDRPRLNELKIKMENPNKTTITLQDVITEE